MPDDDMIDLDAETTIEELIADHLTFREPAKRTEPKDYKLHPEEVIVCREELWRVAEVAAKAAALERVAAAAEARIARVRAFAKHELAEVATLLGEALLSSEDFAAYETKEKALQAVLRELGAPDADAGKEQKP